MQRTLEHSLKEVDSTIQSAVRHKLRVTLRASDFREQNQKGLDVLQEIRLKLVRRLSEDDANGSPIQDLNNYARTVAYRECANFLRAEYPLRTSLKNSLQRILENCDEFSCWEGPFGELTCGYPGWRNQSYATDARRVAELRTEPYSLPAEAIPARSAESMRMPEWRTLIGAVFQYVDGPVALDDLIAIVAPVVGMEDVPNADDGRDDDEETPELENVHSTAPSPYSTWLTTERLKIYWSAILKLLTWHRVAYLLNVRDGDLEALPLYGVATLEQIGDALEFGAQHFMSLARELSVQEPRGQAKGGRRFLFFWKHLPLEDNIIAVVLEVTRAQVISFRNKARERLKRMLKDAL
jgi:hypothetical protein